MMKAITNQVLPPVDLLCANDARHLLQHTKVKNRAENLKNYLLYINRAITVAIEEEKDYVFVSNQTKERSIIDEVIIILINKGYAVQEISPESIRISWAQKNVPGM